jgi:inner membrane protein
METPTPGLERIKTKMRDSLTVRLLTIGFLMLLLLIPLAMVMDLIRERSNRSEEAIRTVSADWAGTQTLVGPVLTVPYREAYLVSVDGKEVQRIRTRYLQVLPDDLAYDGTLEPTLRSRGIYDVVVYQGPLKVKAQFNLADAIKQVPAGSILWNEAAINLHVSDLRGIANEFSFQTPAGTLEPIPGLYNCPNLPDGIHAPLGWTEPQQALELSFDLDLRGSASLQWVPLGKVTHASLQSPWPHPKFSGSFLPMDRTISEGGFQAQWKVLHLNRPIPQIITDPELSLLQYTFGTELLMPSTQYQMTERTAKYGVLVIGLTFLVLFFTQALRTLRIHPFQYILVGLALVLFYTLLLAFSEFMAFGWSYLLASTMVIGLLTGYLAAVVPNRKSLGLVLGLELLIYGFIYVIISLEDTALLVGSLGLFITLAAVMLASRKINWYQINGGD